MFVIKIVLVCGCGFIQVDSKLGIVIIDPKKKEEYYLKELKKVMTEPGHDPGPLNDWGSFEDFSNDPEYLRDKKSKENYFKGKYKK